MRSRDTKPDDSISIAYTDQRTSVSTTKTDDAINITHTDQKTSISFTTGCNNQTISINDAWSKTSDDNLGTWCELEGADTLSQPNEVYINTKLTSGEGNTKGL